MIRNSFESYPNNENKLFSWEDTHKMKLEKFSRKAPHSWPEIRNFEKSPENFSMKHSEWTSDFWKYFPGIWVKTRSVTLKDISNDWFLISRKPYLKMPNVSKLNKANESRRWKQTWILLILIEGALVRKMNRWLELLWLSSLNQLQKEKKLLFAKAFLMIISMSLFQTISDLSSTMVIVWVMVIVFGITKR